MGGQGKHHRPVVFPKLVYLYSKEQHKRQDMQELFDVAIKCSSKAMYPDYLALDTVGDVSRIFKKHGVATSPMGCRAYLSEYVDPVSGKGIAIGRANIGAVSLNLPMIWMKSQADNEPFEKTLTFYLDMIRNFLYLHFSYIRNIIFSKFFFECFLIHSLQKARSKRIVNSIKTAYNFIALFLKNKFFHSLLS